MTEQGQSQPARTGWLAYGLTVLATAGVTVGITALLMNIRTRKEEARQSFFKVVDLDESTVDPAVWGKNFPRQYASYLLTADSDRTSHGGSEGYPPSKLEKDPRLITLFGGYPFAVDFREKRGHAYMLVDQKQTERVKQFKQPGACLHCHSSVIPTYYKEGGGTDKKALFAGFEKVCATPLAQAFELVQHPVSCIDCHEPTTLALRVQRPAFLEGIANLASGDAPTPHLPSIERWRKGSRKEPYDPNALASRQEMRSFVCGQCHVEYYFKGPGKKVTYPWSKGLKMDDIEAYYDEVKFNDWTHKQTRAGMIKAQHPEFELWSQGIHARSGVACADCHMPYTREGAVKISDHNVRSPMLNISRACETCHRYGEAEIRSRVQIIQDRNRSLMGRAENAVVALIEEFDTARKRGVPEDKLEAAKRLHRQAHWRVDFVNAENSMGFHAPQEAARILGEAIDFASRGQIELVRQAGK